MALADPFEKCQCRHRAAIAARLAQAIAARDVYLHKANDLQEVEKKIAREASDPVNLQTRLEALHAAYDVWLHAGFNNEFGTSAGGTPGDVEVAQTTDPRTCQVNQQEVMRTRSTEACAEIGEIDEMHENYHHDVCTAVDAKRNGGQPETRLTTTSIDDAVNGMVARLPSGDALDEVGAYSLEIEELTKLLNSMRCGGWSGTITYKVELQDQGEHAPLTNWSRHKSVDVEINLIGGFGTAHSHAAITNIIASRQYRALGGGQKDIIAIGSSTLIGDVGGTTPASVNFEPVNGTYNFAPIWTPINSNIEGVDCDHDKCTKKPQQLGTYPVEISTQSISGTTDDPAHVHGHLDGPANVVPPGHWSIDWDLKRDPGGPTP